MMVHLFLDDGEHKIFKRSEVLKRLPPEEIEDTEALYACDAFVGYFDKPQAFVLLPMGRVKAIHMTRKAGEPWE